MPQFKPNRDALAFALTVVIALFLALSLRPRDVSNYGYLPDPEGARKFAASLDKPTFSDAAPDVMDRADHVDTYLWRAMNICHREVYGHKFEPSNQGNIGSCVGHAAAHCVYASACVDYVTGDRDEPPLLASPAACYGGSRVEARNKDYAGYSPGSTGYSVSKWLRDWGVIWRKQYPTADTTKQSTDLDAEYGAYGCGGRDDNGRLDDEAKKQPCLYVAQVKTWDELVAAVTSGHPVLMCSGQGFTRTVGEGSWARPQGRWSHAMGCIGVRFDTEGAAILNSWGDYITYTAPRYPDDLPDGVFWAERSVVERMLSSGDCWAISSVAFKWRPVNHDGWMTNE